MSTENKNKYIKEIHSDLLDIMNAIHNVCSSKNIKYYLVGGSLLGAIRHKGFIPWDDDFDIAICRSDLDRFISSFNNQDYKNLSLNWYRTDTNYHPFHIKIVNDSTIFLHEIMSGVVIEDNIAVDVFILDEVKKFSLISKMKKYILKTHNLYLYKEYNIKSPWYKYMLAKIFCTVIPHNFANICFQKIMKGNNRSKHKYFANYCSQYSIKSQIILKAAYGEPQLLAFEDKLFYAPENPQVILQSIYGPNFMDLPPKSKRRTHYPIYVKTSNGTEFRFHKNDKIIKVKDGL